MREPVCFMINRSVFHSLSFQSFLNLREVFVDIHHNAEDEDDNADDSTEVTIAKPNHIDCGFRLLCEGTVVVAEGQQPCSDCRAKADTDFHTKRSAAPYRNLLQPDQQGQS